MNTAQGCDGQLRNETGINVVALLKAEVGERRCYRVWLDAFPLGDDLVARGVTGEVRLVRLRDRVLVNATLTAEAELECVRCLSHYGQRIGTEFSEEYWQTVDVRTGISVQPVELDAAEPDEEHFTINDLHEVDLGEALRQHLVLALPMRPDCGDLCSGPEALMPLGQEASPGRENPFAALASLLDDGDGSDVGSANETGDRLPG